MTNEVREFAYTSADFKQVCRHLYQHAGIRLSDSKDSMVYSRLARRIRQLRLSSFADYLEYLEQTPDEEQHFINALTTNLTSFFREPHHFEQLAHFLQTASLPLTIWCAASSTGEEPYSIAMVVQETLGERATRVQIIASDIDSQVLQTAKSGVYPLEKVQMLSDARKRRFFLRGKGANAGLARVSPTLAQAVQFQRINLLDSDWQLPEQIDVIFCRNVMIYFDKDTQARVLGHMVERMPSAGLYFAGHSENFTHLPHLVRLIGKTTYQPAVGRLHGGL